MSIKRKQLVISFVGVIISAIMQLGILTVMTNNTPIKQSVVLFIADMALITVVNEVKMIIHKKDL